MDILFRHITIYLKGFIYISVFFLERLCLNEIFTSVNHLRKVVQVNKKSATDMNFHAKEVHSHFFAGQLRHSKSFI
jgi:hypothetical protein